MSINCPNHILRLKQLKYPLIMMMSIAIILFGTSKYHRELKVSLIIVGHRLSPVYLQLLVRMGPYLSMTCIFIENKLINAKHKKRIYRKRSSGLQTFYQEAHVHMATETNRENTFLTSGMKSTSCVFSQCKKIKWKGSSHQPLNIS